MHSHRFPGCCWIWGRCSRAGWSWGGRERTRSWCSAWRSAWGRWSPAHCCPAAWCLEARFRSDIRVIWSKLSGKKKFIGSLWVFISVARKGWFDYDLIDLRKGSLSPSHASFAIEEDLEMGRHKVESINSMSMAGTLYCSNERRIELMSWFIASRAAGRMRPKLDLRAQNEFSPALKGKIHFHLLKRCFFLQFLLRCSSRETSYFFVNFWILM